MIKEGERGKWVLREELVTVEIKSTHREQRVFLGRVENIQSKRDER